jgi:nicotinamidase/pyrazinamidase
VEALVVVDVQNDFCPGGALAVADGDQVVPFINALRKDFGLIVFTQDWHPRGHASFASSHPGKKPYDQIELHGQPQTLWPDHCVQESRGAEFHAKLDIRPSDPVFKKGSLPSVDSYSGFLDNDRKHETGLREFLKKKGADRIVVVGLATDYCVKFTALDGLTAGFQVKVLRGGCRAVNLDPKDEERTYQELQKAGAKVE